MDLAPVDLAPVDFAPVDFTPMDFTPVDCAIVRAERRLFEDGGDDWKNVAGHEATLPILCKGTELKPEGIRPDATFIDHGSVSSRRKCRRFVCESTTAGSQ